MIPLKIVPTQTAAAPSSGDAAPNGSDSESDFGPILQAAASPAGSSGQTASRRAPADQSDSTSPQDSADTRPTDQAPTDPDPAVGRRTGRGIKPAPLPGLDAIAAMCAAAASGVATPADTALAAPRSSGAAESVGGGSKPAMPPGAIGRSSTGKATGADKAASTAPGGAAVNALDVAPTAQASPFQPGGSALHTVRATAQGTPVRTATDVRAALAETNTAQADRAAADAARALDQTDDDSDASPTEQAGADSNPAMLLGLAISTAGSAGVENSAATHRPLSAEATLAVSDATRGAPLQASASSASSAAAPLSDPTGATVASAGGAFGNVTNYAPDARASVATPVGQPGFGQELSERVLVLARGGAHSAQISLEPAGLGPVGVSIQVHGHDATLVFTATHEATRNALEAALPRLREMFASCGMQLSDATVGDRPQPQWSGPGHPQPDGGQRSGDEADAIVLPIPEATVTVAARAATSRLVDTYA